MGDITLDEHLRRIRRKRWDKATKAEKFAAMQHVSRSYWDALSPEQRSAEMKRRAKKRRKPK